MRILVTSIIDLKKSQHNRPHQFAKYLSENHEVTVISINDWWKERQGDLKSYSKDFSNIFDNIDYEYLTDKKISPIVQETLLGYKVNNLINKKKFDVHLNYSTLVSGYLAARRIKTVYDIADDLSAMIKESTQIPPILRPLGGAFGDMLLKKNIEISNTVTLTTANLGKKYNISESKSKVISNGVDTNLFKNCGNALREKLNLDGFLVGYVGVLREWIDLETIFSILPELSPEIKIVVVGKEGQFEENLRLVKKYGVDDRVVFTGMVPYSQVPKYISSMDVCIIPFRHGMISENAVPLKLFEYMACEKPIISSRLRGINEAAGNRVLYASNREEWKNKINQLYDDVGLRKKMGIQGRKFVEQNHDWSKMSQKMGETLINIGEA
jgi:glycosyltransferase involved in cell wall biosynthesis